MKRTPAIIISLLIFGVTVIFILYTFANKLNNLYNFSRQYPTPPLELLAETDIKYNSYYIAGATESHTYLGNAAAPSHLLVVDKMLTDTQHVRLKIKSTKNFKYRSIKVNVDSPYFYLTDGSLPATLRGTLNDWEASRFKDEKAYFSTFLPINKSSFALTMVSSKSNENILAKATTYPPYIQLAPSILEKQVDGIFCTEGLLHYSKELDYLVYLYRYRNQFICMDTSFNVIYRGNTIDSISVAQIEVAEIKSDNSKTLAKSPLVVNKQSRVSGNWLFVNSNLLAKNDHPKTFEESSIIDVYDLKDGIYKFSFKLYHYQGGKMGDFKVIGNRLVVLHDHFMRVYRIKKEVLAKYLAWPDESVSAHESLHLP